MDQTNEPLLPRPQVGGGRGGQEGTFTAGHIKKMYGPAEAGVQLLTDGHVRPTQELIAEKQSSPEYEKRQRYAVLDVHREKAAVAVAAGASNSLAAAFAGCSPRQVRKYLTTQAFRERVLELRSTLMGRIEGRILAEMMRRTEGDVIKNMDNSDLVRFYDRAVGASRMRGGLAAIEESKAEGVEKYEMIIEQLTIVNPSSQSVDFPEFEPTNVQLPGVSSPVDG